MRVVAASDRRALAVLLDRGARGDAAVERRVARIVAGVRRGGDTALFGYARRFDGLRGPMEMTGDEVERAAGAVPHELRRAIRDAAARIRRVAASQVPKPRTIETAPGVRIEQRVLPLDRVGCYVPGGRHPLPSSLLMTAIPARVAGVPEIVAVCPQPDDSVCCAALEAGVTRLFRLGGAHGIAALAYGTRLVPRVDKIVGPGNAYVAAAKALVSRDCAIDFLAGPSEIVVLSSAGRPAWIAADLIAQAEHDPDARAILITPSRKLAAAVAREVERQMPGAGPAPHALGRNGAIVVSRSVDEAVSLCQRMAPEHVVCDTAAMAQRLTRAGTVFVGRYSAQAAGDYATGSNHVLPTSGAARARGGLSAADFVRVQSVQRLTGAGLRNIAAGAITLARAEGLTAHAASIAIRIPTEGRGSSERVAFARMQTP